MKIKIFFAFLAIAALIFLSCNWFRSKKNQTSNPLVGEWKLDSIRSLAKDTSFFLTRAIVHDTSNVHLSFTKDTILLHSRDHVDTIGYSFDATASQLTLKGTPDEALSFSKVNDSLVSLVSKDSMIFFLQKK
jgi:hypothetical protein